MNPDKNNRPEWRAAVYDRSREADVRMMETLLEAGTAQTVCDRMDSQLEDLAQARVVRKPTNTSEIDARIEGILNGLNRYDFGRWIYYPWLRSMVHVLPPEQFRELRLDRNRHKITAAEQVRLSSFAVGIVGLSTGNVIARTLCLEGTSERFKLADFDSLELSNLNRIEGGLHELGLSKTTLAARRLVEINPYAVVVPFESGLTEENLDEFLIGEPCLGVVIDECDDLRMKLLLRERARSLGIPVLMATSDRGMLDVERFDLEPGRPIFHGLLADISSNKIGELTDEQKLSLVLSIVGIESMSTRAAASLLEIRQTISTWPQLASDVMLGGAAITAAVRRLALNEPLPSGRHFVDLDEILSRIPPKSTIARSDPAGATSGAATHAEINNSPDPRLPEFIRFIVEHALLAPSAGNNQPWQFYSDGLHLWLIHDRERSRNLADVESRFSYLGLGAALENIRIAAAHLCCETDIEFFPHPSNSTVVACMSFRAHQGGDVSKDADLFPLLPLRVTNRRRATPIEIPESQLRTLAEAAEKAGAVVRFLTSRDTLSQLGRIIGACDRIRFLCRPLHEELIAEIRWNPAETQRTRNGLDLHTLELTPAQAVVLKLLARSDVASLLRQLQAGSGLKELSASAITNSSAVGLLSVKRGTAADILRAGTAFQRLWLLATRFELGLQPLGAIAMFSLLDVQNPRIFNAAEAAELQSLRDEFERLIPTARDRIDLLLFRLSKVLAPSARSLRLPISQVLFFGEPPEEGDDAIRRTGRKKGR